MSTTVRDSLFLEMAKPFHCPMDDKEITRMASLIGEAVRVSLSSWDGKTIWGVSPDMDAWVISSVLDPCYGARDPLSLAKAVRDRLVYFEPVKKVVAGFLLLCRVDRVRYRVPEHNNLAHLFDIYASGEEVLTPFLIKRIVQDLCAVYQKLRPYGLVLGQLPSQIGVDITYDSVFDLSSIEHGKLIRHQDLCSAIRTALSLYQLKRSKESEVKDPIDRIRYVNKIYEATLEFGDLISSMEDLKTANYSLDIASATPYNIYRAKACAKTELDILSKRDISEKSVPKIMDIFFPDEVTDDKTVRTYVEELSGNPSGTRFWFSVPPSRPEVTLFSTTSEDVPLPFKKVLQQAIRTGGMNHICPMLEEIFTAEQTLARYSEFITTFANLDYETIGMLKFPFFTSYYLYNSGERAVADIAQNRYLTDFWVFFASKKSVMLVYIGTQDKVASLATLPPNHQYQVEGQCLVGPVVEHIGARKLHGTLECLVDRFDGNPTKMGQFGLHVKGMTKEYDKNITNPSDAVVRYKTISTYLPMIQTIVSNPEVSDKTRSETFQTLSSRVLENEDTFTRFRYLLAMSSIMATGGTEKASSIREITL